MPAHGAPLRRRPRTAQSRCDINDGRVAASLAPVKPLYQNPIKAIETQDSIERGPKVYSSLTFPVPLAPHTLVARIEPFVVDDFNPDRHL